MYCCDPNTWKTLKKRVRFLFKFSRFENVVLISCRTFGRTCLRHQTSLLFLWKNSAITTTATYSQQFWNYNLARFANNTHTTTRHIYLQCHTLLLCVILTFFYPYFWETPRRKKILTTRTTMDVWMCFHEWNECFIWMSWM